LLFAAAGSAFARINIPDWVRATASIDPGKLPPETKAVVLLDQTDYTVTGPGDYIEHSRWIAKILRPEGRSEGDLLVGLGHGEKLNSIHAWTIDAASREYELTQKDFTEKSFLTFELYSDIKTLAARAPAAEPGSVIAFEFEIRHHAYVNQINQFFQEPNPVHEMRLSLTLPQGWECKDSWPTSAPVQATQTAANRWQWTAHDLAGIEDEPEMPDKSVLLGRVSLTYFAPEQKGVADWNGLGHWYAGLTTGRREATPEISGEVKRLIAGDTDFDSKVRVLSRFLQSEIRYVEIRIGNGYQPHAAAEVFRHRYGDCKDKATLLSSMLAVAGIHSDYVLIDTDRGFVNPAVPSVWFDHAILAIELPGEVASAPYAAVVTAKSGKRYIIFDPTDEYTPLGSLRSALQDSYALLVSDSGGELIRTPLLAPETNLVARTGNFVLGLDGSLSGEVAVEDGGDFAAGMRDMFHSLDQRERDQLISRQIGMSIQGFSLEDVDIKRLDQPQSSLLIQYKIATPLYAQIRGPLMLVRPRVLGDKAVGVEHKPRRYPIELLHTAHETDTYEIEIPKGYQVDDLPDPVKIDVGFASYESKLQVDGSKLRYWREYVVRDLSVPPEKYSEWVRLQGTIGADESAAAVFKRTQ
jgi:hypothetical protein